MADISQLEVNGTTYDICDATARDSLSNYVLKTGPSVRISATAQPGVSFIDGAKGGAALNVTKAADAYAPMVRTNTNGGGAWCIGNYNDEALQFNYVSPTNLKNSKNLAQISYLAATIGGAIPTITQLFSGSFDNTNNKSVTLTQTAANFKALIVVYEDNSDQYGSTFVYSPNGKRFSATTTIAAAKTKWGCNKSKTYIISGTSISTYNDSNNGYWTGQPWFNGNNQCGFDNGNFIGITQVFGINW